MSAFTFNKDTIDLLVSAAILGSLLPEDMAGSRLTQLVHTADAVGRALWKENITAVNHRYGTNLPAPVYEWQPVADLMGLVITDSQALQIERSRREFLDQCAEHPAWAGSMAAQFLESLGNGLAVRLQTWPQHSAGSEPRAIEYLGMESDTVAIWKRSLGIPATPRPADSAKS